MPTAHVNMAGAAPKAARREGVGRRHAGEAAAEVAEKALSSCTNAPPGMMGARGAQLLALLLAPTGTTWSRAVGIQADRGRRGEAGIVVGVQGAAPAPTRVDRLRQELMAAPHPADLAGMNLTIYTHANQL